jgi:hypothetical protein
VASREGEGARFTIRLPISHASAGKGPPLLETQAAEPVAETQEG